MRELIHHKNMARALEVAQDCSDVEWYGVGSIIVDNIGDLVSTGFTGELTEPDGKKRHAEDCAIQKAVSSGKDLSKCTIYSTMEPCSERASGKTPCIEKIVEAKLQRVVFGAKEPFDPALGIICQGKAKLEEAGIEVIYLSDLKEECLRSAVASRKMK